MSTLFFDCSSGASGDMLLGALVDAGAPPEVVRRAVEAVGIDGWSLDFDTVSAAGVRALRADVATGDDGTPRRHRDIVGLLESSNLPGPVRARALRAFDLLGRAEARIHGIDPGEVHFHEVGSLDAIVDVVGCSAALEHFHPGRVVVSPIATGSGGEVASAHGRLPLPAPAVTEIVAGTGARLFGRGSSELVTPTGAALLVAAADSFGELPVMTVDAVGHGAGARPLPWPNIVRVFVGREAHEPAGDAVVVETNLDDMSPELLAPLIERLLGAGAQDAWFTPIVMKKGRPALTLSALVAPETRAHVVDLLFEETTTFGVRWSTVAKHALERRWLEVEVDGHRVRVKVAERDGRVVSLAPEHADALAAAEALGRPLRLLYSDALRAAEGALATEEPRARP